MTRDTFDRFTPPERGRFGDRESAGERPTREAHSDLVDLFVFGPPPTLGQIRSHLAGRNLACWCEIGAPCHADVLLRLANVPRCDEVTA